MGKRKKNTDGNKRGDADSDKILIYKDLVAATDNELQRQLIRKEHIENRTGFILALWGILLGVFANFVAGLKEVCVNESLIVTIIAGVGSLIVTLFELSKTKLHATYDMYWGIRLLFIPLSDIFQFFLVSFDDLLR